MEIINIIAIALSPLIAVRVSAWLQTQKEKRLMRMNIFMSLMSTRHHIAPTDETVRSLNMIDVVFCDEEKIKKLWREYFEMLYNPPSSSLWEKKKFELITEMAKVVGFEKEITLQDVERVYSPIGINEDWRRAREILDELLRVLKESKGLQVVPKVESMEAPAPPEMKK